MLGWVKDGQRRRGNRFIASELGKLDYAAMARTMGCRGIRVESLAELATALDGVRDSREPTGLDVVTTEHAPFLADAVPVCEGRAGRGVSAMDFGAGIFFTFGRTEHERR